MGCLGKCPLAVLEEPTLKAARPVLSSCCNEGMTQEWSQRKGWIRWAFWSRTNRAHGRIIGWGEQEGGGRLTPVFQAGPWGDPGCGNQVKSCGKNRGGNL